MGVDPSPGPPVPTADLGAHFLAVARLFYHPVEPPPTAVFVSHTSSSSGFTSRPLSCQTELGFSSTDVAESVSDSPYPSDDEEFTPPPPEAAPFLDFLAVSYPMFLQSPSGATEFTVATVGWAPSGPALYRVLCGDIDVYSSGDWEFLFTLPSDFLLSEAYNSEDPRFFRVIPN